jgi:hypothetical protein
MGIGLKIQREVTGPDGSGTVKEETENSELEWAKRHQEPLSPELKDRQDAGRQGTAWSAKDGAVTGHHTLLSPELKDRQDAGRQGTACSIKDGAVPGHYPPRGPATDMKMPVKPAERKTGLRGQAIAPGKNPKSRGKIVSRELMENDSDVPYAAAEKAGRDLICSLIERQDRAMEGMLLLITDMQYRLDDLEAGRVE